MVENAEATEEALGLLSSVLRPLAIGTTHFMTRLICVIVGSLAAASALSMIETLPAGESAVVGSRVLKRTKTASLTAGNDIGTETLAGSAAKRTDKAWLATETCFMAAYSAGSSVKRDEAES